MAASAAQGRDVSAIPPDKVEEARRAFFIKHADATPEKYDGRDLDKLRRCDHWVKLYLLHQKQDIDKTVRMIEASLSWRKSMEVLDITEDSFRKEDLEKGALYFHGTSKSGDKILYFRCCEVKKDVESLRAARRMIAMQLERQQRLYIGHPVVVLLDLTDVGMGNVDLELIKFLITSFTTYFPALLSCMLIYDMPWLINAIWNIVKQLLSEEEQKHVMFVKKATIQQYINADQLPKHMGGTDDYVYRYVPWIEPAVPDTAADAAITSDGLAESSGIYTSIDGMDGVDVFSPTLSASDDYTSTGVRRRLPFSGAESGRSSSASDLRRVSFRSGDMTRESQAKSAISELLETREVAGIASSAAFTRTASNGHFTGTLLLEPSIELVFVRVRPEDESRALLRLTNTSAQPLMYKVKTTNPDHYRVKAGAGCLTPDSVHTVQIALLGGKEVRGDKFLVQFAPSNDDVAPTASFWNSLSKDVVQERRLRCVMKQWRPPPALDSELGRRVEKTGVQASPGVGANGVCEDVITPTFVPSVAALSASPKSAVAEAVSGRQPSQQQLQQPQWPDDDKRSYDMLTAELRSLRRLARLNTVLLLVLLALFALYILPERLWPAAAAAGSGK